jgi:hypothetical protein
MTYLQKVIHLSSYCNFFFFFKKKKKLKLNRLFMPSGQMKCEFLSKKERFRIEKKEADNHFKGMEVPLIEPGLQESTIFLKKWKNGKGYPYALSKDWTKFARRNQLESSDSIQLWSFRVNQSHHLALIKLDN